MAVHDLSPAYVEIDYVTLYGFHTMTRPTLAWSGVPWSGTGEFATHDGAGIGDDTMIMAFINNTLGICDETTTFTQYRIFSKPTPEDSPVLVNAVNLTGITGESTATGWGEAVQRTYSFYTEESNAAKIVILDSPGNNSFAPIYTLVSPDSLMAAEFTSAANGWCGRDGARPAAFNRLTQTLNEKLRRNYRLG